MFTVSIALDLLLIMFSHAQPSPTFAVICPIASLDRCEEVSEHKRREKILFRNGELTLLWPDVAARCRWGRGMVGQDGLRADADAW
jgi:hypothetical protein